MSEKRWSEERGYEVARQLRLSGQTMSEFARAHGYDEQRVRYWRERARVAKEATPGGRGPKLLPGVVVNVGAARGVSVSLPRGVTVEVYGVGELPATWLAEVVRALESSR